MRARTRRSVGKPTAAVILRTWWYLPSRTVSATHECGRCAGTRRRRGGRGGGAASLVAFTARAA